MAAPLVAAAGKTCTTPNADVTVKDAAPPALPKDAKLQGPVTASALVTIGPDGKVLRVTIDPKHSSGNMEVDQAVLRAARNSTYSPKVVNCKAVQGTYRFFVRFDPKQ